MDSLKDGIKAREKVRDMWWKSIEALEEVKKKKEEEEEEGRAATMASKMESYSLMDTALHPGINLSNYRQLSLPHKHKKCLMRHLYSFYFFLYFATDALAFSFK